MPPNIMADLNVWMNQDSYAIAYFTSTALAQQCMHSQIQFSNSSWALVRPFCLHPVSFASAFIHPVACFSMYLILSYAQASQCQEVDACSAGKRWWQGSFLAATCPIHLQQAQQQKVVARQLPQQHPQQLSQQQKLVARQLPQQQPQQLSQHQTQHHHHQRRCPGHVWIKCFEIAGANASMMRPLAQALRALLE